MSAPFLSIGALNVLVPLAVALLAWAVVLRLTRAIGPPPSRVAALLVVGHRRARQALGPSGGRSPPLAGRRALVACAAVLPAAAVGLPMVVLGTVVLLAAPRVHQWAARRRRERAIAAGLSDVVDLLAVAVGAGLTVRAALVAVAGRGVGPLAQALGAVVADAEAGTPLADALDGLPHRAGEPTRGLAASLAGCVRYGTPLGPTLAALAVEARDAERRRMEQAARRVPVLLLFPLVLCILPAFALLTVAPLLADALGALRL